MHYICSFHTWVCNGVPEYACIDKITKNLPTLVYLTKETFHVCGLQCIMLSSDIALYRLIRLDFISNKLEEPKRVEISSFFIFDLIFTSYIFIHVL